MCMIVCNRFFFLVFSLLSIFYFIAFHRIYSRSDISAGSSLSVPQYSAVPFCCTDVWFFSLWCAVYWKNAANSVVITANVCRQHVHHGSSAEYDGARWQSRQVELSGGSVSEQRDLRVAARRQRRTGVQSYDSLRRRQPRLRVGRRRRRRLVHVQTDERARIDAGSQSLSQCHL